MRSELLLAAVLSAPAAAAAGERIEAVVAVVDGRPVLLSELRAAAAVKGLGERRAREELIDQFLMEREAQRFAALAPADDEVEALVDGLAVRAPDVPRAALRRLARREAWILRYVEFRFRPLVTEADETEVQGDWLALPEPRPPFAEARAPLREARSRRALDARVEAWVADLRRAARIRLVEGWRE
ncbi:MAG: hypothetical protein KJ067_00430 [Vicinamibacteria bacterium]|jgi:hypothetical protein|nr:hypothetical protein [Vicinamibacteria bacterium]